MFFGAITTDRFGYRKSFLFWLLILTGSTQCFRLRFSQNIEMIFTGELLWLEVCVKCQRLVAHIRARLHLTSRQRYQGYIYTWQSDFYRVKAVTAHAMTMM
jgi:hypothetical protein